MTKIVTLGETAFSSDGTRDDTGTMLKLLDLGGWYSTTMAADFTERERGDGDHSAGPSRRASKTMTLKAMVTSTAWDAAEAAWETIAAVAGDGGDLSLRYEDTDVPSVRVMRRVRIDGTIEPIPFAPRRANVAIPLRALDPRKYAEQERLSAPALLNGMQPAGSGLRYPLFTPSVAADNSKTALLDYGGIISFNGASAYNLGKAAAYPVFYITGGNLSDGFTIRDTTTDQVYQFGGPVGDAETLVINMATKRAISGQNDRTDETTVADTMLIPGGESRSYVFTTLGSSDTGSPSLTVGVTDTWW